MADNAAPARRAVLGHDVGEACHWDRRPSGPPSRRPSRSSGHGVLRSPGAGRFGPQGIGFPHSSVHVRMNVGGVRTKLIFKGLLR